MTIEKTSQKTKSVESSLLTNRGLEEYKLMLEITEDFFIGKDKRLNVVDLGSGAHQKLATDIKKLKINCDVISVDPKLSLAKDKRLDNEFKELTGLSVDSFSLAAVSNNLPFPDNSIDRVVALYSVPFYLKKDFEQVAKTIEEIVRVLQQNGIAKLFPILGFQKETIENVLNIFPNINFSFHRNKYSLLDEYILTINKF